MKFKVNNYLDNKEIKSLLDNKIIKILFKEMDNEKNIQIIYL